MSASFINGASFFTRSFETVVVREDLLSQDETRQLNGCLHTIALMCIGKDMSAMFTELSSLTSSTNLSLKRLAYLYLQQYSRIEPEKAVLQAGSFVKDSMNESPLMRGASIRAMTSLQASSISDFVKAPLRRLLEDRDPYVRRNAVLGFLKVVTVTNSAFSGGMVEKVKEMLQDDSPCVAAASVIVLRELHHRGFVTGTDEIFASVKSHFVKLLDIATEWPAFYILEGLGDSFSVDKQQGPHEFLNENEDLIMRVLPFMCYANPALVISSVRVISQFLLRCEGNFPQRERWELEERFGPCVASALVSLTSSPRREVQYVALRNILFFLQCPLQRYFHAHLSAFRLLFDDPIYVQIEKLRCLVSLVNEECGPSILNELWTHSLSVETELARESVRSIGTAASNLESLAEVAVSRLENLIENNVSLPVVEEAVVVLHQLSRVYPNRFPSLISTFQKALGRIQEPNAVTAAVWALSSDKSNAQAILTYLEEWIKDFDHHPSSLQMAMLTAAVKAYLFSRDGENKELGARVLESLLNDAIKCSDVLIRDRAFFYLKLLLSDPSKACQVFCSKVDGLYTAGKPVLEAHASSKVLHSLGTLTAVEHKPVSRLLYSSDVTKMQLESSSGEDESEGDEINEEALSGSTSENHEKPFEASSDFATSYSQNITVLFPEETSGVQVDLMWNQLGTKVLLNVGIALHEGEDFVSQVVVEDMQLNHNAFGLGVGQVFPLTTVTSNDKAASLAILVNCNNRFSPNSNVEVAFSIRPIGVIRCVAPPIPPILLLLPPRLMSNSEYASLRQRYSSPLWVLSSTVTPIRFQPSQLTGSVSRMFSLTLVHTATKESSTAFFLYGETTSHEPLLYEIVLTESLLVTCSVYTNYTAIALYFGEYLISLLRKLQ